MLFVLVIAAIVITAVIAAAVLLVITAVAVAVILISVAAVATATIRVEFVRRSRFLLFVPYRFCRMSEIPVESTPATNTRRRATDRRARTQSSSSIESDRPDAKVVRREESDSASYIRLHHRDSDSAHHANSSPIADATLLVPQPSNPAPLDSVLSAFLSQRKQLSSELASRDAAQSAAITALSDRLNRLEH